MIPILANKHYRKSSVFDPANLLKQARRQKSIPSGSVPEICVLDPDGALPEKRFLDLMEKVGFKDIEVISKIRNARTGHPLALCANIRAYKR